MDVQVITKICSKNVLAEQVIRVSLINCLAKCLGSVDEFASDVDVSDIALDGKPSDRHPFDELERSRLHEHLVLKGARLSLVRITKNIVRLDLLLRKTVPLDPTRESSTAPTTKTGSLHFVDDRLALHFECLGKA